MLVLFCRYSEPLDAVRVGYRHAVRAVRRGGLPVLVLTEDGTERAAAPAAAGATLDAGPATVRVLEVLPSGCRLGYEAPAGVRLERERLARARGAGR